MNIGFPQYEFKSHGNAEWEQISEITALENLADTYHEVVPVLTDLLGGAEINVKGGICRAIRKA